MKKILKIGFVAVLIMMFSAMTVFAEDIPYLTVEEAVSRALNNSSELAKIANELESISESEQIARRNLFDSTSSSAHINYEISRMQSSLSRALAQQNAEVRRDMIELSVIEYFIAVIQAENSLEQFDKSLEIAEQNFRITEARRNLGHISEIDYIVARNDLQTTKDSRQNYVDAIETAYRTLNRLIGSSVNSRYNLVYEVEFESLGNFNVSSHIMRIRDNDSTIKRNRSDIELNNFYQDTHISRNVNEQTGEILNSNTTRESYSRSIQEANLAISDRTRVIEDTVVSRYNDIISLENEYKELLSQLQIRQRQLDIAIVKADLGRITPLELAEQEFAVQRLENDIQNLVFRHHVSVMEFTNINLAV